MFSLCPAPGLNIIIMITAGVLLPGTLGSTSQFDHLTAILLQPDVFSAAVTNLFASDVRVPIFDGKSFRVHSILAEDCFQL